MPMGVLPESGGGGGLQWTLVSIAAGTGASNLAVARWTKVRAARGAKGQNPNLLTITLPDPAGYQDGDRVEVVDVDETCSFNQITLVATINLQVNHQYVMNTDGLSVTFDLDKAHNNWVLV